jgi:DNA-binding NtrC family response regulator
MNHPFWGNIRELKAYLSDAVARCTHGRIEESHLRERMAGSVSLKTNEAVSTNRLEDLFGHFPTLEELTEYAIDTALHITENNQSQAAQLLGVSRQALHKRLKKRTSLDL